MKKKLIIGLVACVMVLTSASMSLANTHEGDNANQIVSEATLDLTARDIKEYENYQNDLAKEVKKSIDETSDDSNICKIVEKNIAEGNNENTISEKIQEITNKNADEIVQDKNIDTNVIDKYTKKYEINENYSLIVTPTEIYLDEFKVEEPIDDNLLNGDVALAASTWKKVKVVAARSLFTTIGKQAASVHTGGYIQYNGSIAKYYSDFYGYYSLHLTTYKKESFNALRESSGKSYQFRAQGNFYKSALGITRTKLISCKVKVSPSGVVSKSYYPAL